ncbi:hypothetical protein GCK32_019051 [Trichostrongylus colubriformis]|uniref:Uncharacterized protein n=1 Tax=Trichostrongylus colubriformis TaxID=6319 RepID=A0AAN8FI03_TRICO
MILILLTTLIGILPYESSFVNSEYTVDDDYCIYSEVKLQPFKEITNSSLRSFLLRKLGGIANTDCVQSYQAKIKNDSSPFHVFRINRQTKFLRNFSVCGVVTVNDGDFMWTACDKTKFENYLMRCESADGPEGHRQPPPALSCDQTTTPVPQVNPSDKTAPPKPPRLSLIRHDASSTPVSVSPSDKIPPPKPPRLSLIHKDAPSTAAPQNPTPLVVTPTIPPRAVANMKSTTRKGWWKKLNCFSCV